MSATSRKRTQTGFTVLVVEDDENDRFFVRDGWERARLPHRLLFANDGQQAIDYLSGAGAYQNRDTFPLPDLILLDLKLPRKTGFEVLDWIRSHGLSHIPVVVASASSMKSDELKARELGARDFHPKPSRPRDIEQCLIDTCARWLK